MSDQPVIRELKASFRNRGFVIALAILAVAAAGLETTTHALGLHFKKEAVPLRQDLLTLPRHLGPWMQAGDDARMPEEMEHALGTKEYIQRTYVDTRKMAGFDRGQWDAMSDEGRNVALGALRQRSPDAFVTLHIAFYTGLVDTVAHVPERCYVAGGFDPIDPQVVTFRAFPDTPGRDTDLKAKFTTYVDRAHPNRPAHNVAYFFQVNGVYEFDSFQGVRMRLQNIFEKYGYYAKIELSMQTGDRTESAKAQMTDLLVHAMPAIEKCLPDWEATTGQPAALNKGQ